MTRTAGHLFTTATLTTYKGHPLVSLETGGRKPFSFGLAKARAILENIDSVRAFVESGGTELDPDDEPASDRGSSYTRFSSGAEVFTNRNGRCIDAPCCGCCS